MTFNSMLLKLNESKRHIMEKFNSVQNTIKGNKRRGIHRFCDIW